MAQSGPGKIRLFEDFHSIRNVVATTDDHDLVGNGDFYAGGEGFEDNDAGLVQLDGPNGLVTITGANTDADTTFIGTGINFDVGLQGTIVCETRIQMPDLDTKEIFFGVTSILSLDEQLEDIVINASATAVTCVADLAGFYFSDELTASATDWHGIHAGGSTADGDTAANVNLSKTVTANTWQILRLELDSNGNARWFIDGDLVQSVAGAVSTTSDVAVCLALGANTTELVIIDCDYILATANRNWTV